MAGRSEGFLPTEFSFIAPADGVRTSAAGDDVMQGVMVDVFDLSTVEKPLTLAQATNRLIVTLRQRNQFCVTKAGRPNADVDSR